MTQLIVALDNPNPQDLAWELNQKLNINFFKLRFPGLCQVGETWLKSAAENNIKIFADLKLCDTKDSIKNSDIPWLIKNKIYSVSTYNITSTTHALSAAKNSPLKIWQWFWSTDKELPTITPHWLAENSLKISKDVPGIICPGYLAQFMPSLKDTICPGIRFPNENSNGHTELCTPQALKEFGVSYAVVGRPIWQSENPIQAAKQFLEALK